MAPSGKKRPSDSDGGTSQRAKKVKTDDSSEPSQTKQCNLVNPKRIRYLYQSTAVRNLKNQDRYVIYWMQRDQRVHDNWSLIYAQQRALEDQLPLLVVFIQATPTTVLPVRKLKFIIGGLNEVESSLSKQNIGFKFLVGKDASSVMQELLENVPTALLVCDFSPLREHLKAIDNVIPLCQQHNIEFVQLDSHNIVPVWITSDKQEHAARTIRPKIHRHLNEFLVDFPPVVKQAKTTSSSLLPKLGSEMSLSDDSILTYFPEVLQDLSTLPDWCVPGYQSGMRELKQFCEQRLKNYGKERNDPSKDSLSNLSVWFNTGQISVQRTILEIQLYTQSHRTPSTVESRDALIEEAVVRRELSDNFCYYNKNYDSIEGAPSWAKETLRLHMKDGRQHVYELKYFEEGRTHDEVWNAAQKEGEINGKIHGYMRMYWAKKILEWTKTPEDALRIAVYLNDKYNLDGGDPNGYVGVMWSICGLHDQGWSERKIFGKIRFMNEAGCKRKFDVDAYIEKWIPKKGSKTIKSFLTKKNDMSAQSSRSKK